MSNLQKPQQVKNPDFTELIQTCQGHIDFMASDDFCEDNDGDHYVYEAAIEAIFGKNIWDWINARMDGKNDLE